MFEWVQNQLSAASEIHFRKNLARAESENDNINLLLFSAVVGIRSEGAGSDDCATINNNWDEPLKSRFSTAWEAASFPFILE
jgi:hypothetical protein